MIALRKVVFGVLSARHSAVYYADDVPDDAQPPYLTYDLKEYPDGEGFSLVSLDIDSYDFEQDTTILEQLMLDIDKDLDAQTLSNDEVTVTFYCDARIPVHESNRRIKHRRFSYTGRKF